MAISLPADPGSRTVKPFIISFAQDSEPFLGGEQLRVDRLGTRMGMEVTLPPMTAEQAAPWLARLMRGSGDTVVFKYRQNGLVRNTAGAATVSGGAAANATQVGIGGFTGQLKEGQFITFVHGGRRYMHVVTGLANGPGAINVWPRTRTPLTGGDPVIYNPPEIEGLLGGDIASWTEDRALTTGISFIIRESA